jgi:hypothetical protein
MRVLKRICVKELIDHVIDESTTMYAGTECAETFFIYHDALTAWWEEKAQRHIASRGFKNRQIRSFSPTNDGTRYELKLVGDSPELCRALDSHGFAYLAFSLKLHTSLTSILAHDDPRRFNMGTPKQVWSSLERVWQVAPTSAQIVEDVMALPRVLQKIIDAKGCVVPDEFLRSGRRGRRADDKGDCDAKVRKRQRKATHTDLILHSDCIAAKDLMAAGDVHVALQDLGDVEDERGDDDIAMTVPGA